MSSSAVRSRTRLSSCSCVLRNSSSIRLRSATSRSDAAFDRRLASPRATMKPAKTDKSSIPEISVLGFWSTKELTYGRNQYQPPATLTRTQVTDGPMPQYQAEKTIAAQEG